MARRCPKCRKDVPTADETASFAPFCSERCRLLDLGAWLDGEYRIPAAETSPSLDDEEGGGFTGGGGEPRH